MYYLSCNTCYGSSRNVYFCLIEVVTFHVMLLIAGACMKEADTFQNIIYSNEDVIIKHILDGENDEIENHKLSGNPNVV